jgi:arginine utilization protein RocB
VSLDFLPLLSAKEKTPVFDIGPRGKGAHDWTERVDVRDAELRVKTIIEKTIMFYYEE